MDEIPNWEFCMICGGQGDVECILCKANGRKTGGFLSDIDLGVYDQCHGSGVIACRHCYGTGQQERDL